MIIRHLNKTPQIDPSAYVAPNATVCGDVIIGAGFRIMCRLVRSQFFLTIM
jgi:carbonic anhydrase/acetyltransferase-like protein (isoleucine patch superfamily)